MNNMNNSNEKFCTKCGKKFIPVGREVICPSCKARAAEDAKRAAVLRAKRASWTGESVPVRISGRASTVIRLYGMAHKMPFAEALDALLQASMFFQGLGKAWNDITPYKSRRLKKSTGGEEQAQNTEVKPQDVQTAQDAQNAPQEVPQDVPQEVKTTQAAKPVKRAAKAAASKTVKAAKPVKAAKTAGKAIKTTSKAAKAEVNKN